MFFLCSCYSKTNQGVDEGWWIDKWWSQESFAGLLLFLMQKCMLYFQVHVNQQYCTDYWYWFCLSNLQKYRLHTRRPSPSHQAAGGQAPQLVVLGSIWVPPEYATAAAAAHNGGPAIYGAHPASLASTHYCAPPAPQEFYPGPPHQLHHTIHHPHPHHQPHVVYKTTSSRTHSSPESDMQGGAGDRSESIEDGKSESGSWKGGDSGENGAERRGLASLRDEVEKNNGNEITLNF